MRTTLLVLSLLAFGPGGCKRDEAQTSGAGGGSGPAPSGSFGDPGVHGPPVVMHLSSSSDADNELTLRIEIAVNQPTDAPGTLTVSLPPGAVLLAGKASDSVSLKDRGLSRREIKVRTQGPLSEASPIRVELEAADDKGGGFHARRQWPARSEIVVPRSSSHPPGGRPPGPAQQSPDPAPPP